jgi:hypothetical protein
MGGMKKKQRAISADDTDDESTKSRHIMPWLDGSTKKIVGAVLALLLSGGLLTSAFSLIISDSRNHRIDGWTVAASGVTGFALAAMIGLVILEQLKKRLLAEVQPARIPDTHYSLVEIEEEYTQARTVKRKTVTLHVANVGKTAIAEQIIIVPYYDVRRGIVRKVYVEKSPRGQTGPYIVIRKIGGWGSLERREPNSVSSETGCERIAFIFRNPIKPGQSRSFTYEYTYYNMGSAAKTQDLIFLPQEYAKNMQFSLIFAPHACPREAVPVTVSLQDTESRPVYAPVHPTGGKKCHLFFFWPEAVHGKSGNVDGGYGLQWTWPD